MSHELIRDRSNRSASAEVFRPKTEAALVRLLAQFNQAQTPVTIAASRTGLTGSCVPQTGVVIDIMELPQSISEPELKANQALFGPSLLIEDLDNLLAQEKKVYLPTPGYKKCSLGGTVATNASGPRTFSFGSTRNHVWFLRVVLMDGEILEIKRGHHISQGQDFEVFSLSGKAYKIPVPVYTWPAIKNATGLYAECPLDLIDLFIGSEGLLGVITQIGINTYLFEREILTEAYFFTAESEALACAQAARESGFESKNQTGFISLEFMDQGAIALTGNPSFQVYEAALEIEYLAGDEALNKFWKQQQKKYHMPAKLEGAAVPQFRYSIPLNLSNLLRDYGTVKVASDFAVPTDSFPQMYKAYKAAMKKFDTLSVNDSVSSAIWGHIGDGHLHCNFIPQSEAQSTLAQQLYLELAEKCVTLGGVVSAEHGVGKKRFSDGRSLLEVQNSTMIPEIQRVKAALDPLFLLNQGNLVPKPSGKGRKEV